MRSAVVLVALLYILLSLGKAMAEVSPDDLIKATPEANCVEYYTYHDELYCTTTVQSSGPPDPNLKDYEKLNIVFDDRPWKLAWGKHNEDGFTTIEYVPMGDNIENWYELVTSQYYPGQLVKITLKDFADGLIKDLKKDGYDPIVTFHENTENRVIYEFRIEHPDNQIQDELQMLTKDDNGIYILHYVIKESDMGSENREMWIQNLKDSTVKE